VNAAARHVLIILFGLGLLGFLLWGMTGLSPFGQYPGPYGDVLNSVATAERHTLNVVTAINFDYRGFDTLGEEFILFASVAGALLLMRHEQTEQEEACEPHATREPIVGIIDPGASDLTRASAFVFIAAILVFGCYIVLTGHLGVGGGFQGGVILSSAWLLVFLAYGSKPFRQWSNQSALEWFEAAGAGGYALIGCFALFVGGNFLKNVLPLGQTGHLLSSGTIFPISCAVGVEVAAGFVLLYEEFFRALEREQPLRRP